jgi:uncharacterized protein (UPF0297 family)
MDAYGTKKFAKITDSMEIQEVLKVVVEALVERDYDPLNQLVGYLVTEDPAYITGHKNARKLMTQIERDKLLRELLKNYLGMSD